MLSHWRAQFSESATTEGGSAGPWLSKVLVGRTAAALFLLCGASSLASLVQPTSSGGQSSGAYVAAAVAGAASLLAWWLPWSRWPRWASLFLVPVGFGLVALQSSLAIPDAVVYSVFFVLLFAWIGVAFPQGTALLALTLFAAAYVLPLVFLGRLSGTAVDSALYVGVACLLVGETLALLSTTLRLNQVALWRARAAVNDIGAELASTADPETLWSSIALRLSELVDLPDSDVYRLMDDGGLVVLASVYDEKPCPEQLHVCTARDVWGVDREALDTREPVFIASPADPRLSAAEREDMRRWREQAMLIVPLVARDEVIGLVEISETREGRTIAPEQIATVTAVCRLIAMALHDADTMHAQEARARRLASLFESSRAVAGAATMEEALAVVARCAGEVFGVSECVAYEHDPDQRRRRRTGDVGEDAERLGPLGRALVPGGGSDEPWRAGVWTAVPRSALRPAARPGEPGGPGEVGGAELPDRPHAVGRRADGPAEPLGQGAGARLHGGRDGAGDLSG